MTDQVRPFSLAQTAPVHQTLTAGTLAHPTQHNRPSPVFENDRRCAEAFARGGVQAEREERTKLKEEEEVSAKSKRLTSHVPYSQ